MTHARFLFTDNNTIAFSIVVPISDSRLCEATLDRYNILVLETNMTCRHIDLQNLIHFHIAVNDLTAHP